MNVTCTGNLLYMQNVAVVMYYIMIVQYNTAVENYFRGCALILYYRKYPRFLFLRVTHSRENFIPAKIYLPRKLIVIMRVSYYA